VLEDRAYTPNDDIRFFSGRPELKAWIQQLASQDDALVGVVVCGPSSMAHDDGEAASVAQRRVLPREPSVPEKHGFTRRVSPRIALAAYTIFDSFLPMILYQKRPQLFRYLGSFIHSLSTEVAFLQER